MGRKADIFQSRMNKHHDELKWLYMELYGNGDMFAELCSQMYDTTESAVRSCTTGMRGG